MHNLEERISQWRGELMTVQGLSVEKVDALTVWLREDLDAVSSFNLSPDEKFALADYRLRNAANLAIGSKEEAKHKYGLGDLALMIGGYLLFGIFFFLVQSIAIPLTSINRFMRTSPDLTFIVSILFSAILIAAFAYGIWRFVQPDSLARLFGYRAHRPNSASTIAKSALAVYLIIFVQKMAYVFAMNLVLTSGFINAELYGNYLTRSLTYNGYTMLLIPTILYISLMWIQHIKYTNHNRSADPTHA